MEPLISVIIPCYNVEDWLGEAIDSLLSQTWKNWEGIMVEDCSNDSTLLLAERLAESDSRLRLIRQDRNRGLSAARNLGLDNMQGDYVAFLDSDDMLLPDALRRLYDALVRTDASVVEGRYIRFESVEEERIDILRGGSEEDVRVKDIVISGREAVRRSLYQKGISPSAWGKLYKVSLWKKFRFTPGILYEDMDLFYRLIEHEERYAVIDCPVYLYRQRSGSILHVFNSRRLDVLDITARIEAYYADDPSMRDLYRAASDRRLSANFNIWGLLLNASGIAGDFRNERIAECRRLVGAGRLKSLIDPSVRLKNRLGALLSILLPPPLFERLLKRIYSTP